MPRTHQTFRTPPGYPHLPEQGDLPIYPSHLMRPAVPLHSPNPPGCPHLPGQEGLPIYPSHLMHPVALHHFPPHPGYPRLPELQDRPIYPSHPVYPRLPELQDRPICPSLPGCLRLPAARPPCHLLVTSPRKPGNKLWIRKSKKGKTALIVRLRK